MSHPDLPLNVSSLDRFCERIRDPELCEKFRMKILNIGTDNDGNFASEDVERAFKNGGDIRLEGLGISFVETAMETARESARGLLDLEEEAVDSEDLEVDPMAEVVDPADDILDPDLDL